MNNYRHRNVESKWPRTALASRRKLRLRSRSASMRGKQANYNHSLIEEKWQRIWREREIYKADDNKPRKFYMLVELTYTSGDLHMGHWFAWTAPDAFARMKRMQGYNVLFPVGGFDAFGLPAENAAIKHGIHPREWTYKNMDAMRAQFEKMGPSFDWDKEVITCDPDYYKWTQWLFLQLYKKGLAYRGKVWSNWCPECKTVLANEHVENGCCWRHAGTPVEQKLVDQWLFKITDYADKLIWKAESPERNRRTDWPRAAVDGQNNWIGKSKGLTVKFSILPPKADPALRDNSSVKGGSSFGRQLSINVWTKFWETIFGTTFLVLSPEHPLLPKLKIPEKHKKEVSEYIKLSKSKTEKQRKEEAGVKTGVFTGLFAKNPANGNDVPIWIADYVLINVGTGAVMGVPAHDKRDFEFAKKYQLDIVQVVSYEDKKIDQKVARGEMPYEGEGILTNSDKFNGMDAWGEGKTEIAEWMTKEGFAEWQTTYHLRDWSISRRRYWAAPVPIIYCRNCYLDDERRTMNHELREGIDYTALDDGKEYMIRPVPEADLPVTLPPEVDYIPTGKAPLATATEWVKVACPLCGKPARREVETLDTYVDSSWYFFRYPSVHSGQVPFDPKLTKEWMPIEVYFGGPEHILGHTLYARFITKFLHDEGYISFDEFAKKRIHHGVILGPDGYRMSKSRGNIVNPDEQVEKFGADAVRLCICFMGPHDKGGAWTTEGIEGSYRFLGRIWRLFSRKKEIISEKKEARREKSKQEIISKMHQTIKKVTNDIERVHTHTAIAAIMEYVNVLTDYRLPTTDYRLRVLVQLLAPFAPHLAEEIWVEILKQPFSVHKAPWPRFDEKLIVSGEAVVIVQVNGKLRGQLTVSSKQSQPKAGQPVAETAKVKIERLARRDPKVGKWLEGKTVKKAVFVPGKLINFVLV